MKTSPSPPPRRLALVATTALGLLFALRAPASAQTVYVTNSESRTVVKFTTEGKVTKFADVGPGQPSGLARDGRGNLYHQRDFAAFCGLSRTYLGRGRARRVQPSLLGPMHDLRGPGV